MKIESIRIRNYRTVDDLTLSLDEINVLCGGNSSGKSNVIGAIRYAFDTKPVDRNEVLGNLPLRKVHGQGAPKLSTWIDVTFSGCPVAIAKIVGQSKSPIVEYNFRAIRSGNITRKLMGQGLDDESFAKFLECFELVYIPPIRDLNNGGMQPFHSAFSRALAKARGANNLRHVETTAKELLHARASTVLADQKQLLINLAGVDDLKIDCADVTLDDLYEKVTLAITVDGYDLRIDDLGTGHQSLLIMDLFEHLESPPDASRLFLFEEPDNHLHPSAIRTVAQKMINLSTSSQVLATTHSPIFIHALGMDAVRPLSKNDNKETILRNVDLSGMSKKQLSSLFLKYGLRITESLFCNKAIIVEGAADALTLKIIYQLREGHSVDDDGILIIDASGKNGVKELAILFDNLDVPFIGMLDWDAVEVGDMPQISAGDDQNVLLAIQTIRNSTPENRRTKRGVLRSLTSIEDELQNPLSGDIILYKGSTCEEIINTLNRLNKTEKQDLALGLKVGRKTWYTPLLKKSCLWVHDKDLESTIIPTPQHAQEAHAALSAAGIPVSIGMSNVRGLLHNSAHRPEVFETVITALEGKRLFSKTRFNTMYKTLFS